MNVELRVIVSSVEMEKSTMKGWRIGFTGEISERT